MTILSKAIYRIQRNPYQIHRTGTKKNFLISMETQKTLSSQNNLEKDERSWRNHTLQTLHTLLL